MSETSAIATAQDMALMSALPPDIEHQVKALIKTTKLDDVQAETVLSKFAAGFEPFLRLRAEAESIVVTDASQTDLIARAKEIDQELLAATQTLEKVHKTEKEFWLRGGQMVDGCKRIPTNAIAETRDHLKKQFDYVRNIEIARLNERESLRLAQIAEFGGLPQGVSVRTMSDEQFALTLAGAKAEFERKAEEDRLERERLAVLKEENERLTRERDEAERKATAERLERERIEGERLRLEREKQAEIDRVAREKAEDERQIAAREEAARLAPDKEKLIHLGERIHAITLDMPDVDPKFDSLLEDVRRHLTAAFGMITVEAHKIEKDCPF